MRTMDKEQLAIERLKAAAQMSIQVYQQPLVITTSGGKDSSVLTQLAIRAGIPFEIMHNHTTADAPETVYFVRQEFRRLEGMGIKCTINLPVYKGERTSMWSLIPQKLMPPTRLVRYCCSILKERGGAGRFIATGVRWAESVKRKNSRGIYETMPSDPSKKIVLNNDNDDRRRLFENCRLQAKRVCNPIIDWTDSDIWDYIKSENLPINPLYGCGFSRVGCIGCPTAQRGRSFQFAKYPKYREMYIRAFERMLAERVRKRRPIIETWGKDAAGIDVFHWWMEDGILPGQIELWGDDSEEQEEL